MISNVILSDKDNHDLGINSARIYLKLHVYISFDTCTIQSRLSEVRGLCHNVS